MAKNMTIRVAGQLEVCQLARILIEHRTPFSLKPVPTDDLYDPFKMFTFELTIPSGLALGTYDFALADRIKY